MRFSFIFAQKDTGRTPSHLWYFGQRCWLLDDLTDFFGYNTKLPLHMGRAERAAIFLTVTDLVLGLGPPADAGSWVLGLQGTLGLGSWGQAPRPVPGAHRGRSADWTQVTSLDTTSTRVGLSRHDGLTSDEGSHDTRDSRESTHDRSIRSQLSGDERRSRV